MLEGLLETILNNLIGDYVENINKDKLHFSVWKGDVVLRNLRLKKGSLDDVTEGLVDIADAQLETLTIKVPWTSLTSSPVQVTLEGLHLLCGPQTAGFGADRFQSEQESAVQLARRIQQAIKSRQLKAAEARASSSSSSSSSATGDASYTTQFVEKIIANLEITIRNVHVRYEDDYSLDHGQFAFGLMIDEFTVRTTDEKGQVKFVTPGSSDFTCKLITLKGMAFYWNSDCTLWGTSSKQPPPSSSSSSVSSTTATFSSTSSAFAMFKNPHKWEKNHYVLHPLNVSMRLMLHPKSVQMDMQPDKKQGVTTPPLYHLSITIPKLELELSQSQYRNLIQILENLSRLKIRLEAASVLAKLAPFPARRVESGGLRPGWCCEYWHHAVRSIISMKFPRTRFRWEVMQRYVSQRREYTRLWQRTRAKGSQEESASTDAKHSSPQLSASSSSLPSDPTTPSTSSSTHTHGSSEDTHAEDNSSSSSKRTQYYSWLTPLDSLERQRLRDLEECLDVDSIVAFRALSDSLLRRQVLLRKQQRKAEGYHDDTEVVTSNSSSHKKKNKNKQSWTGWMGSMVGVGRGKKNDDDDLMDDGGALSTTERAELAEVTLSSREQILAYTTKGALSPKFVKIRVDLELDKCAIVLSMPSGSQTGGHESKHEDVSPVVRLDWSGLLKFWGRPTSWKTEVKVTSLQVRDCCTADTVYPDLILKNTEYKPAQNDPTSNWARYSRNIDAMLTIEANPKATDPDSEADFKCHMKLLPQALVVSLPCIQQVVHFFIHTSTVGKSNTALRAAASKYKQKKQADLIAAITDHRRNDISIVVDQPTLLFPVDCASRASPVLILDFSSVSIESKSLRDMDLPEHGRKLTEKVVPPRDLAHLYDAFMFDMKGVRAFVSRRVDYFQTKSQLQRVNLRDESKFVLILAADAEECTGFELNLTMFTLISGQRRPKKRVQDHSEGKRSGARAEAGPEKGEAEPTAILIQGQLPHIHASLSLFARTTMLDLASQVKSLRPSSVQEQSGINDLSFPDPRSPAIGPVPRPRQSSRFSTPLWSVTEADGGLTLSSPAMTPSAEYQKPLSRSLSELGYSEDAASPSPMSLLSRSASHASTMKRVQSVSNIEGYSLLASLQGSDRQASADSFDEELAELHTPSATPRRKASRRDKSSRGGAQCASRSLFGSARASAESTTSTSLPPLSQRPTVFGAHSTSGGRQSIECAFAIGDISVDFLYQHKTDRGYQHQKNTFAKLIMMKLTDLRCYFSDSAGDTVTKLKMRNFVLIDGMQDAGSDCKYLCSSVAMDTNTMDGPGRRSDERPEKKRRARDHSDAAMDDFTALVDDNNGDNLHAAHSRKQTRPITSETGPVRPDADDKGADLIEVVFRRAKTERTTYVDLLFDTLYVNWNPDTLSTVIAFMHSHPDIVPKRGGEENQAGEQHEQARETNMRYREREASSVDAKRKKTALLTGLTQVRASLKQLCITFNSERCDQHKCHFMGREEAVTGPQTHPVFQLRMIQSTISFDQYDFTVRCEKKRHEEEDSHLRSLSLFKTEGALGNVHVVDLLSLETNHRDLVLMQPREDGIDEISEQERGNKNKDSPASIFNFSFASFFRAEEYPGVSVSFKIPRSMREIVHIEPSAFVMAGVNSRLLLTVNALRIAVVYDVWMQIYSYFCDKLLAVLSARFSNARSKRRQYSSEDGDKRNSAKARHVSVRGFTKLELNLNCPVIWLPCGETEKLLEARLGDLTVSNSIEKDAFDSVRQQLTVKCIGMHICSLVLPTGEREAMFDTDWDISVLLADNEKRRQIDNPEYFDIIVRVLSPSLIGSLTEDQYALLLLMWYENIRGPRARHRVRVPCSFRNDDLSQYFRDKWMHFEPTEVSQAGSPGMSIDMGMQFSDLKLRLGATGDGDTGTGQLSMGGVDFSLLSYSMPTTTARHEGVTMEWGVTCSTAVLKDLKAFQRDCAFDKMLFSFKPASDNNVRKSAEEEEKREAAAEVAAEGKKGDEGVHKEREGTAALKFWMTDFDDGSCLKELAVHRPSSYIVVPFWTDFIGIFTRAHAHVGTTNRTRVRRDEMEKLRLDAILSADKDDEEEEDDDEEVGVGSELADQVINSMLTHPAGEESVSTSAEAKGATCKKKKRPHRTFVVELNGSRLILPGQWSDPRCKGIVVTTDLKLTMTSEATNAYLSASGSAAQPLREGLAAVDPHTPSHKRLLWEVVDYSKTALTMSNLTLFSTVMLGGNRDRKMFTSHQSIVSSSSVQFSDACMVHVLEHRAPKRRVDLSRPTYRAEEGGDQGRWVQRQSCKLVNDTSLSFGAMEGGERDAVEVRLSYEECKLVYGVAMQLRAGHSKGGEEEQAVETERGAEHKQQSSMEGRHGGTITAKRVVTIALKETRLLCINDCAGRSVPFLMVELMPTDIVGEDATVTAPQSVDGDGSRTTTGTWSVMLSISASYFNPAVAVWEPLLERSRIEFDRKTNRSVALDEDGAASELQRAKLLNKVQFGSEINLNITIAFLELLLSTTSTWKADFDLSSAGDEQEQEMSKSFSPVYIRNHTGLPLRYRCIQFSNEPSSSVGVREKKRKPGESKEEGGDQLNNVSQRMRTQVRRMKSAPKTDRTLPHAVHEGHLVAPSNPQDEEGGAEPMDLVQAADDVRGIYQSILEFGAPFLMTVALPSTTNPGVAWTPVKIVAVGKVGASVHRVIPVKSDASAKQIINTSCVVTRRHRIVVNVSLKDGSRVVTLSSPLELINDNPYPLEVALHATPDISTHAHSVSNDAHVQSDPKSQIATLGPIAPNSSQFVPLDYLHLGFLSVRPVHEGRHFGWSTSAVSLDPLLVRQPRSRKVQWELPSQLQCPSRDTQDGRVCYVHLRKSTRNSKGAFSAFSNVVKLHFGCALHLCNSFPYVLTYKVAATDQKGGRSSTPSTATQEAKTFKGVLAPGQEVFFPFLDLKWDPYLVFRLQGFGISDRIRLLYLVKQKKAKDAPDSKSRQPQGQAGISANGKHDEIVSRHVVCIRDSNYSEVRVGIEHKSNRGALQQQQQQQQTRQSKSSKAQRGAGVSLQGMSLTLYAEFWLLNDTEWPLVYGSPADGVARDCREKFRVQALLNNHLGMCGEGASFRASEAAATFPDTCLLPGQTLGNQPVHVTLYENQRYVPFSWRSSGPFPGDIAHTSDGSGRFALDRTMFNLPTDEWEWLSEWKKVASARDTDAEGFQYATNFAIGQYHQGNNFVDTARRRKWVRLRKCNAQTAPVSLFGSSQVKGVKAPPGQLCVAFLAEHHGASRSEWSSSFDPSSHSSGVLILTRTEQLEVKKSAAQQRHTNAANQQRLPTIQRHSRYELGVHFEDIPGPNGFFSKLVRFVPRFLLVNTLNRPVLVRPDRSSQREPVLLSPGTRTAWFEFDDVMSRTRDRNAQATFNVVNVAVGQEYDQRGGDEKQEAHEAANRAALATLWSGPLSLETIGECSTACLRSRAESSRDVLLRASIRLEKASLIVTFAEEDTKKPLLRIENRSTHVACFARQRVVSFSTEKPRWIPGDSSGAFAWWDNTPNTPHVVELDVCSAAAAAPPANKAFGASASSSVLAIPFDQLGYSCTHAVQIFAPDGKTLRSASLCVEVYFEENTKVLCISDASASVFSSSHSTQSAVNDDNLCISVISLDIPQLSVSLIDRTPNEIALFTLKSLALSYGQNLKKQGRSKLECVIGALQLDHQSPSAVFPVALYYTPQKTRDRSQVKPFFHLTAVRSGSSVSESTVLDTYEHVTAIFQPFTLNIDQLFATSLISYGHTVKNVFQRHSREQERQRRRQQQRARKSRRKHMSVGDLKRTRSNSTSSQNSTSSVHSLSQSDSFAASGPGGDADTDTQRIREYLRTLKSDVRQSNNASSNTESNRASGAGKPGGTQTKILYLQQFVRSAIVCRFTFNLAPDGSNITLGDNDMPRSALLTALVRVLANVDDCRLNMKGRKLQHLCTNWGDWLGMLVSDLTEQAKGQIHQVIGSARFLGNPAGLVNNLSTGVFDLIYEPGSALVQGHGVDDIGAGVAKGVGSLLKNSVYGVANFSSGITSSLGDAIATLSQDSEFMRERMKRRVRPPSHVGHGLANGTRNLAEGILDGVTGVITNPIYGLATNGVTGMAEGLGKGVVGFFVKPLTGVLDAAASVSSGLQNTTTMFDARVTRVRYPRVLYHCHNGVGMHPLGLGEMKLIKPYDWQEATAQCFLCQDGTMRFNRDSNVSRQSYEETLLEREDDMDLLHAGYAAAGGRDAEVYIDHFWFSLDWKRATNSARFVPHEKKTYAVVITNQRLNCLGIDVGRRTSVLRWSVAWDCVVAIESNPGDCRVVVVCRETREAKHSHAQAARAAPVHTSSRPPQAPQQQQQRPQAQEPSLYTRVIQCPDVDRVVRLYKLIAESLHVHESITNTSH